MLLIVNLLKKEPWRARDNAKGSGDFQVYEDGQWRQVAKNDLPRVTKLQAQAWLILYNLLLDPESQRKYQIDEHRKEAILTIRPLIDENLTNQIPVLELLQRYLDELVLCNVPESISHSRIVQEVRGSTLNHLSIYFDCVDLGRGYIGRAAKKLP